MPLVRRALSTFAEWLVNPANKVQSYISRSKDPYLNLSIEDYILRKSPPDSTVLFLYTNRPCIVIGRNQNPWSEVNLGMLRAATRGGRMPLDTEPPDIGDVDLVRRRSGGGAVFHDDGNLNWSVTCPRADFTRDKQAEMVVRVLRSLGVDRARVNERHDIVLDQGHEKRAADPQDTHRTVYTVDAGGPRPLKVSGSAYKITSARALHHATTLLASPNLHIIPQYLRSPARPFIQAKGVESVSSPVGNIGLDVDVFQKCLQEEFAGQYGGGTGSLGTPLVVGDEHLQIPDIQKGYEELQADDWMWSQTPQFSLNLQPFAGVKIDLGVHRGIINAFEKKEIRRSVETINKVEHALMDQRLLDIRDWNMFLRSRIEPWDDECMALVNRLEELLPVPQLSKAYD